MAQVPTAPPDPNIVYVAAPMPVAAPVVSVVTPLPMHLPFGTNPLRMTCPHCQNEIVSKVENVANKKTHIIALGLCVLGFCCCAPCVYCMDVCQAKKHTCPKCQALLGIYDKVLGF